MRNTAVDYAKEPVGAAKNALRLLLEDYQTKLETIKADITNTHNINMESEDFVKFALDFTQKLKDNLWSITFDERKGG